MQEWLTNLSVNHVYLVYLVIILFACAEGPILSMIFGVLIKLNLFHFWPVYTALMLGDVLGDSAWYYVGRRYGHRFIARFGKYVNVTEEAVAKVTAVFHTYKHPILFISKISNGFGFSLVTLITAGMVKIPFGRYLFINLAGQFIWSGVLIGIGYFFSEAYLQVNTWFERIGLIAAFIILVTAFIGYTKYLKKKIS